MKESKKKIHAKHLLNELGVKSSDEKFDFLQKEAMYYIDLGHGDSKIKRKIKTEIEKYGED